MTENVVYGDRDLLSTENTADEHLRYYSGRRYLAHRLDLMDAVTQALGATHEDSDTKFNEREAEIRVPPFYQSLDLTPSENMWLLREWDGYVIELDSEQFVGLLSAVGADGEVTERLEYPISALPRSDKLSLSVGSVFRLSCGFTRKRTGTVMSQMVLYFRPKSASAPLVADLAACRIERLFSNAIEAAPLTRE